MPDKPSGSRKRSIAVILVFLLGLSVAAFWWFRGPTFWSDGSATRIADADARLREVLWTPPQPLAHDPRIGQQYEPSLSPDGNELYFVRGKPGGGARIYMS